MNFKVFLLIFVLPIFLLKYPPIFTDIFDIFVKSKYRYIRNYRYFVPCYQPMKNIYFANHVTYSTNDPSDKKIMIVVFSQSKTVSLDIYQYLKEKNLRIVEISWRKSAGTLELKKILDWP